MSAIIGILGFLLFVVSLIMAIIQRKTRLKFWLLSCVIGLALFAIGISLSPEPAVTSQQKAQQIRLQNEKAKESLDKLSKYLEENFGGKYQTWWYSLIKNISLSIANDGKAVVTVTTDIYPDKEGEKTATLIGNVILTNNVVEVKSVTVEGQGGRILSTKSK